MYQVNPIPDSWKGDLDFVDGDGEHGRYFGCRCCGARPTQTVSPEASPSVVIPWCGEERCRSTVEQVAETTLSNSANDNG